MAQALVGENPHFSKNEDVLCGNKYPQEYVDDCKKRLPDQLAAYQNLPAGPARQAFESLFFNNLVPVLDSYFVHRTRGLEGKDGNLLNKVRLWSSSLLENKQRFKVERAIQYKPEDSILQPQSDQPIALTEAQFGRLPEAFFAEIQRKSV